MPIVSVNKMQSHTSAKVTPAAPVSSGGRADYGGLPSSALPDGTKAGRRARGRRAVCACILSVAGVLAGCDAVPPAGRQMLLSANDAYARGEYNAGERAAAEFLKTFPSSSAVGEAYYLRGMCLIEMKQREAGRASLTAGAAKASREDQRATCQTALANLAYEDGDMNAALAGYATAIPYLPERPPTDEALYRYGVCLQRLGRWGEARRIFSRLLDQFPGSRMAGAARSRFAWRHDSFAIQCGTFLRVDEANQAADVLKDKGLSAAVEYVELDGLAAWRVLVGEYATYEKAQGDLTRVRLIVSQATIVP